MKSNKDVECTTCNLRGKSSPAESRCLDCGDYLCLRCYDGHNTSSTTWNHKKVLLKDIKTGSYDQELRTLQKLKCTQHKDRMIEYFCDTCHTPVCIACVLLVHRDHTCLTAIEAVTAQRGRLASHIIKVKEKLQHLEDEQKIANENLSTVNKIKTEAFASIENGIKAVLAEIEYHGQQALELIETKMKERLKGCNSQVEKAKSKVSSVKGCLDFCEAMMEQGKDEEVLYLEETIIKRLLQIEQLPAVELEPIPDVFPDINDQIWSLLDLEHLLRKHVDTLLDEYHSKLNISSAVPNIQKVTFQYLRTFDTKHDTDDVNPVIKGMTIKNDTIFLSDNANGKIKRISTRGIQQKCCTIDRSFSPYAVAVCKDVTGAVHENFLYLFNEKGTLTQRIMLAAKPPTGQHFTFALANFKNKGFIVGNLPVNEFRIYDLDGKVQNKLAVHVASPLANLRITKNGHILTCEWGNNSVCVRNLQGKILVQCPVRPTWKVNAACEDKNGLIYAVDSFRGIISVFDQDGNQIMPHAFQPNSLEEPVDLAFDDEGLMYLVNLSGKINVYKIIAGRHR